MLYPCATTMWCFHIFIWGLFQANIDIFDCFQSAYIFAPPSLSCHTMDISPGPPLSKTNHLARLKWEAAWQEARVEAMCLQKTRCAVLMKFTLWSIDLPCSLIDAVFKNSLVWGMRSYRAAGTPVGHICLCLQNEEHSVSSKKRGLTGPPRAQWVTLSPCTRHTHTHTHKSNTHAHCPIGWEKESHILHVLMHLHIHLWFIIDCLVWSASSFPVCLLLSSSVQAVTGPLVLQQQHHHHKSFTLTDVKYIHFI